VAPAALVSEVVLALVVLLLLGTAAAIRNLVKGCSVLRRWRREAAHPYRDALLKSPLVPGVSVIAVVPQGTPERIELVRRLLALEFGEREVVVVLNGPSPMAVETWLRICQSGLASPGGLALPRILTNVSALVSGSLKGVVSK